MPAQIPPTEPPAVPLQVAPPVDDQLTVRQIAEILAVAATAAVTLAALKKVLYRYPAEVVEGVFGLGRTTNHLPNYPEARPGGLTPFLRAQKAEETLFRAAYFWNATKRVAHDVADGESLTEALHDEEVNFERHQKARLWRLSASMQAQTAADFWGRKDERGTLLGWYLNPMLNNEAECIQANGGNFYLEEGTKIGYPGQVHNMCGCYAGPEWLGGMMVNDKLGDVIFQTLEPKRVRKK